MFFNYLAAALRNLARNKLYAAINVMGLAGGFAAAIVIGLFVRHELTYDRFIPGYDRIYAVGTFFHLDGRAPLKNATTSGELAAKLKLAFPAIEEITRLSGSSPAVRHGDVRSVELIYWADPNVFSVLPLPALAGDLGSALKHPDGIVLTRRMARKYFGKDLPLGEVLLLDQRHPMRVTAILKDLPSNTHLNTEIIASGRAAFSSLTQMDAHPQGAGDFLINSAVYFRLAAGASIDRLQAAMPKFIATHKGQQRSGAYLKLLPITRIHLYPGELEAMKPGGSRTATLAMLSIGILILLVASINFVNLMTARLSRRVIEVGMRKVMGAERGDLILQFIGESLVYMVLGVLAAVALVELAMPAINAFLDRSIEFKYWSDPQLLIGTALLTVLVGVLAGAYPALVISAIRPAAVFRSTLLKQGKASGVRQALVIVQFSILIGLMIATTAMHRQMVFSIRENLKINSDQVVLIFYCDEVLKERIQAVSGVMSTTCSSARALNFEQLASPVRIRSGASLNLYKLPIDFEFFDFYGIHALAGRLFSPNRLADAVPAVSNPVWHPALVINERAARLLGYSTPQQAIGQNLTIPDRNSREIHASSIIGVVPDFWVSASREPVNPAVYFVDPFQNQLMSVRLKGTQLPEALAGIDRVWAELTQGWPIRRMFLNDHVQQLYRSLSRQAQLFGAFAGLALLIAGLGLFGLAAFMAERRTNEIGVRKAMGADRGQIIRMLLADFSKPVLWANLLAWPVAGYFITHWLQGFAYHIELEAWMFLVAAALTFAIAVLTVLWHAFAVARAKPIDALRYE